MGELKGNDVGGETLYQEGLDRMKGISFQLIQGRFI